MLMSKELDAAREVLELSHAWEDMIGSDQETPALPEAADLLGAATFHFGLCELYDRKAGRGDALRQGAAREAHYRALSRRHQEKGLRIMRKVVAAAEDLARQIDEIRPGDRDQAERGLEEFRTDLFEYLSEGELKISDMDKLARLYDEVSKQVLSADRPGEAIAQRFADAYEARNADDRGLRDNLPWWKIAIIAAYLAVSIWKIWRCIVRDRCSRGEKAALESAAVILGISLKFC